MQLTLLALEQAEVYTHSIHTWRDCPDYDRIWPNFGPHFVYGKKECIRTLTAGTAGYHGTHDESLLHSRWLCCSWCSSCHKHVFLQQQSTTGILLDTWLYKKP